MKTIPLPGMTEVVEAREREREQRLGEARQRITVEAKTLSNSDLYTIEAFDASCLRLQRLIRDYLTWTQNS